MSSSQAHVHNQEDKNRRMVQNLAQQVGQESVQHEQSGVASGLANGMIDSGVLDSGVMRKLQHAPKTLAPSQVLQLQRLVGNRAVQRMLPPKDAPQPVTVSHSAPRVQTLRVDAANTPYEEEADQIADAVVQGKRLDVQRQTVQRQTVQRQTVQRQTPGTIGPEGGDLDEGMERQIKGATGGGSLPGSVRNTLEPKLGVDLKGVRVHTGAKSAGLNRQLNAKAFTYKNNIFYGDGQSPSDLPLTTHEIVHTMHQGAVHKKAQDTEDAG